MNNNEKLNILQGEALPKINGYVGEPIFKIQKPGTAYYDITTDTQVGIYTTDLSNNKSNNKKSLKKINRYSSL